MESLPDQASPAAAELMIELAMDGFHLMDYAADVASGPRRR